MQNSVDILKGLSQEQVLSRQSKGQRNTAFHVPTKTIPQIVKENVFTLFNLVNILLAIFIIMVGSYKNLLFMGVILSNIAIGIFQAIRAKRTVDKLSLISSPKAIVLRDGEEISINSEDILLDDVVVLANGMQICADSMVIVGECEVDESLLTGESDPVLKKSGDELLSGSFVVSGRVKAQVIRVGKDNYAGKITAGAKYIKKNNSQMMKAINAIIQVVSLCIVPFAVILFFKSIFIAQQDFERGIVSTVAAIIGMIPEGLVLLTSVALAVSVIRLGKSKVLVQDMYAIESLARVDVLCLDKTGTITEGVMKVDDVVILAEDKKDLVRQALNALTTVLTDNNPTFNALKAEFSEKSIWQAEKIMPFSSARKYSGAVFETGTFLIGAAEFIIKDIDIDLKKQIEGYSQKGQRVLLLGYSAEKFVDSVPTNIAPLALVLISDKIRKEARATLKYFREQGVALKIISGDNPVTVSKIAQKAGLESGEKYIDMSTVKTDEALADAAMKYSVFGRVTPYQKLELIKALKAQGHTVGMTGDGANDVLALKEADCSIAMQEGSDAARNVSNLVLLDSNFSSIPKVVGEGRRTINNIERSASLFLVKTVYVFLLAILLIFVNSPFLFEPVQMTAINFFAIGVPSFILALEPNVNIVKGSFITNILSKAIPRSLAIVLGVFSLIIYCVAIDHPAEMLSTMAIYIVGYVSLAVLFSICRPFNLIRTVLFALMFVGYSVSIFAFPDVFELVVISKWDVTLCIIVIAISILLMILFISISDRVKNDFSKIKLEPTNKLKLNIKQFKLIKGFIIVILGVMVISLVTAITDMRRSIVSDDMPIFAIEVANSPDEATYLGLGYKIVMDKSLNNDELSKRYFYYLGSSISNQR